MSVTREVIDGFKNDFRSIIKSRGFSYFLLSIIFTLVWANIVLEILVEIFITGSIFIGLILPLVLLVSAIQYKSRLSFAVTMIIFLFCALYNLATLIFAVQLYYMELNGLILNCSSCCPICDIKESIFFIVVSVLGVLFMHSKRFLVTYLWKKSYTWVLFLSAIYIHLCLLISYF